MENNNGRGIFYGVIGVATLVVAIIGATFAYFSATITQQNAISGVNSTTVNLTFTQDVAEFKTDMVPVQTTGTNDEGIDMGTAFKSFPGNSEWTNAASRNTCKDTVGNSICSVYQFTVGNPSTTTSQTVVGSITTTANSGFTNLKYAVFKGTITDINAVGYDVNATPATTVGASAGTLVAKGNIPAMTETDNLTQTWDNTTELLGTSGSTTYTVVVWLEEAGEANNAEQGKTFAASITFASPSGSGVTGVLAATT